MFLPYSEVFLFQDFVCVLKSQENMLVFMWHYLLFHGAKSDFVVFVSLYLWFSMARIRDKQREVIAFITCSKICSLAFVNIHLPPDFANFTALVKGGEGQSRAMLLIILKGKSTLNLNLNWALSLFFWLFFSPLDNKSRGTEATVYNIEITAWNLVLWNCSNIVSCESQIVFASPCIMHAIVESCYSIILCLCRSSRICCFGWHDYSLPLHKQRQFQMKKKSNCEISLKMIRTVDGLSRKLYLLILQLKACTDMQYV